mmetsp:Transcript_108020/g.306215  ORF Transcript_108020/g.306215 Transcript_108020/m.306215 type:complete len:439 (+) Transcript_108020:2184-3500(+)
MGRLHQWFAASVHWGDRPCRHYTPCASLVPRPRGLPCGAGALDTQGRPATPAAVGPCSHIAPAEWGARVSDDGVARNGTGGARRRQCPCSCVFTDCGMVSWQRLQDARLRVDGACRSLLPLRRAPGTGHPVQRAVRGPGRSLRHQVLPWVDRGPQGGVRDCAGAGGGERHLGGPHGVPQGPRGAAARGRGRRAQEGRGLRRLRGRSASLSARPQASAVVAGRDPAGPQGAREQFGLLAPPHARGRRRAICVLATRRETLWPCRESSSCYVHVVSHGISYNSETVQGCGGRGELMRNCMRELATRRAPPQCLPAVQRASSERGPKNWLGRTFEGGMGTDFEWLLLGAPDEPPVFLDGRLLARGAVREQSLHASASRAAQGRRQSWHFLILTCLCVCVFVFVSEPAHAVPMMPSCRADIDRRDMLTVVAFLSRARARLCR